MDDNFDGYIGRCLKNWAAKQRPPADIRTKLLRNAGRPPSEEPAPFSRFFSSFANRWDSPGEQLYGQRHWQLSGPFTHGTSYSGGISYSASIVWSFHLVAQQKMVQ